MTRPETDRVPTWHPHPSTPRVALPAGACDAHCHVFGPLARYPFSADSRIRPGDAPIEQLLALHRLLGIEHCVIVQSAVHGTDNSVVADAIARTGGRYRGIALVDADVSDAELRRLDAAGFRGARFNFMTHIPRQAPIESVLALARRLEPIGWHLQIHCEPPLLDAMAPLLRRSPVPVVIDHIARIDASQGVGQPQFRALCALMDDPRFHVKVSGCERITREGWPYRDATPYARLLVERWPDRVFWGTDWPHPNFDGDPPDDGLLVDNLERIAPSADHLRALMVDNPARFYGFDRRAVGAVADGGAVHDV
ncbi:MAG: amidohydrolase [Lautropia sp.]